MVAVPMSVIGRRLTYDDYQALPDDQDYEIVDGVLHVSPRPRPKHQRVAHELGVMLTVELRARGLGVVLPDADLIVSAGDDYVSPDLMVFTPERFAAINPDEQVHIVPDLVVEVLSPHTRTYDLRTKKALYARLGVPHYWIVDADRRQLVECALQPGGGYDERIVAMSEPFRPAAFPEVILDLTPVLS